MLCVHCIKNKDKEWGVCASCYQQEVQHHTTEQQRLNNIALVLSITLTIVSMLGLFVLLYK